MIVIPDEMVVGFQKRDNYGEEYLLGYATYYKGKQLCKKKSWGDWRHNNIEPKTYPNVPRKGFRVAWTVKRDTEWFGTGDNVWRIIDPNGFQLEIRSPNLNALLQHCTFKNGLIAEKCIWAWDRGNMSLVSTNSKLYKEAVDNTKRTKAKKITARTVVPGSTVLLEDNSEQTFLGLVHCLVYKWKDTGIKTSRWSYSNLKVPEFSIIKRYALDRSGSISLVSTPKIVKIVKAFKGKLDMRKVRDDLNERLSKKTWGNPFTIYGCDTICLVNHFPLNIEDLADSIEWQPAVTSKYGMKMLRTNDSLTFFNYSYSQKYRGFNISRDLFFRQLKFDAIGSEQEFTKTVNAEIPVITMGPHTCRL